MFDHLAITCKSLVQGRQFYTHLLKPLGHTVTMEGKSFCSFGPNGMFTLSEGKPSFCHIAFIAKSRDEVDKFYKAGLEAGAKDNGAPGVRTEYAPNYYAAFIFDPDGNNIEAVCYNE
ncbi:uncharacterized protein VTP21DRAFT_8218 [Calcarisporiella thermophila]|uniref:uncharacterized protein n=1 Tax=Calcarisporiella thermophila TaxID=911321 RepID=UPI0037435E11